MPTRRPITARQRRILRMLAEGLTYAEAASAIGISKKTLEDHVQLAYGKLDAENLQQALVNSGIVTINDTAASDD